MHILLFILYAVFLSWVLTRRPFFRDIRPGLLIAFFALRVASGCLHNWVAYHYYPNHGDIWTFFQYSFTARHLLFTDLHAFWVDNSSFANLPHNLIECMHLVFNFLSFDNFYINTLFFSFLTLGGQVALFRVFYQKFGHDTLSAACMLLLPSVLFWTSCVHTEGITYAILGWLFYTLHRCSREGWSPRRVMLALLLTALAIFFRPALAIGLLPALAFMLSCRSGHPHSSSRSQHSRRSRPILLISAALIAVLLTGLSWWKPDLLSFIPRTLSARQEEFQTLAGNSRIFLPSLEPNWKSFWGIFPHALFNGLFQPLPGAGGQKVYLLFSIELLTIWIIIILSLLTVFVRLRTQPISSNPIIPSSSPHPPGPASPYPRTFAAACILLALLGIFLIGCIIPFVGAIVRYRSIYLPFLLAPFIALFRSYGAYRLSNNALTRLIFK